MEIKKIDELHRKACEEGKDSYIDPETGYLVFTELFHKRRGHCCNSGCRHCPYKKKEKTPK
ncbi:hypothetical protein AZI85_04080 [Bdellovibrio bacteriovorus]|uniref:Uncharacterized protein n=1 Tax=Bdellovibrio bacteriovorus TaxID=959 RepID=A0A150WLD1_BDEBC|nr:DUF5522 domain-containing protein [Bdellovibrio bacteriovorus]KYG64597.1 hypothetical protein AZI85_04080 [Bdellovibrio bacteriovorus]